MKTICLVMVAYNSDIPMLNQALDCMDLFDEVVIHVNDSKTMESLTLPERVKIIYREEVITVPEALNEAITLVTSKYILPFTDDDFFNRIELQKLIKDIKADNITTDIIHYPIYAGLDKKWMAWGTKQKTSFEKVLKENTIPFSSIYKKQVWKTIGGYQNFPFSDWLFWLKAIQLKHTFAFWNHIIYFHRQEHKETLANRELKEFGLKKIEEMFRKELGIIDEK